MYGYTSGHITKGDKLCDFLFAFLEDKTLARWVYPLTKEFAPRGANSFI